MKMSELILAIGDDNVGVQFLDQCASDLNYSAKRGTTVTFGTDQPVDLKGTKKLGIVLWLDRDLVAAAISKASPPLDGGQGQ